MHKMKVDLNPNIELFINSYFCMLVYLLHLYSLCFVIVLLHI